MTDHYKDFYESRVRELRGERDRLTAEVKALRATAERVRGVALKSFPDGQVVHPADGMYHDASVSYGLAAASYEILAALDGGAE